ncbi:MAG: methylated-DNA--[protein]-cysteine S-methyltransferase [Spirochaetota bacterium]
MPAKKDTTELTHYEAMKRVIEYVDSIYPDEPDLTEMAQVSGLSDFYFNRLFSAYVGIPPKKYLQFLRRDYAMRVLAESANMIEAAHRSKLSSTGRLHDLFVTTEAVTPGEWKSRGAGLSITYSLHECTFGRLFLAETDKGICELQFFDGDEAPFVSALRERWPRAAIESRQRTDFSAATMFQDLPRLKIHLLGTNFQLKVWKALLQIPEGGLVTYSDVALAAGNGKAIRAAASAIAQNPVAYLIPCHRVIRKTGAFSEYRWGAARKRMLIAHEAARAEAR